MKKAFDQTFRDLKRGVNKKVLKVPSIEQKVLDATSNEPWGPHGTHLADIAQASRNYHEYQMIMAVVWKRLSDSGKNWRHVFKALTILEYLVANGSERVIEDIREHAYQITSLSSFQYIDSTGRDQGSNVRKKSQSLVALVMDKEKIQEAREKATASRDKFRNAPGGTGDEGRYGNNREEDRNGYGREREWDDEYRGRSASNDGDYGPRSQSSDREREDDGHRSSRGSSARVEDASPDASRVEPKLSGQSPGGLPSYEDAVSGGVSPVVTKRDGETATAIPAKPSSPQVSIDHQETPATTAPPPPATTTPPPPAFENEGFDLFDPRGAPAPAPAPSPPVSGGGAEVDLFGSLSDSFSSNALALVPSTSTTTEIPPPTNTNPYLTFDTASAGVTTQAFDDPFGDGPFRAIPSTDGFSATSPFGEAAAAGNDNNFGFGESFDQSVDILADILPPPGPSSQTATAFQPQQTSFPEEPNQTPFSTPFGQPPSQASQPMPHPHHAFPSQSMPQPGFPPQSMPPSALQVQGGQQSMPPSAFQVPGGQQPMPLSALQAPMPQPAFQLQGAQQSMPLPALQVPGGQQSMPQPSFPAQAQAQAQAGFAPQASVGGLSSGFSSSNGQSMVQPAFPAQGMFQGTQSLLQPGFVAQGGQNASLGGFPTNGQLAPPNVSLSQTGFANSNAQLAQPNVSQPGFTNSDGQPAQSNVSHAGFINSNGQHAQPNVLQAGFTNSNGQPAQPNVSQAGFNNSNGQHAQPNLSRAGFTNSNGQHAHPNLSQAGFNTSNGQHAQPNLSQAGFTNSNGQDAQPNLGFTSSISQPAQPNLSQAGFTNSISQPAQAPVSQAGFTNFSGQHAQPNLAQAGLSNSNGQPAQPNLSQAGFSNFNGQPAQPNNMYAGFQPSLSQVTAPPAPQYNPSNFNQHQQQPPALSASTGALALVPQQPTDKKFETKSTVWTDTLNRGLVNLNISGAKTNPLSDIGIDFDAINRKEKRMEKPSKTPVTSNIAMGKAMGSGSGMGRAGAGVLRPAPNPMVAPGMGAPAGYGGVNQPMGINHMHHPQPQPQPQNMGMGMGMGQGFQMQPGFPPGSAMPGNYNPMMGRGSSVGYGQQPYGGYR